MIPGITPELPLRAKVRVGEKNQSGYPTALDHFVCDDPAFERLAGTDPKQLTIRFPYATLDECFPSGLEKWMRSKGGSPILGCYTKGDGTAHRLGKKRDAEGLVVLDPTPPAERMSMPCAAQACPYYGPGPKEGCRPQARLSFFIVGDTKRDSVFKFETKSLNTYETISAVLAQYEDLRVPTFELWAERRKSGAKQFTVVCIREVGAAVRPTERAEGAGLQGTPAVDGPSPRQQLKDYLVATDRWPMSEPQVEWVKKVGPEAALHILMGQDAPKAAA